MHVPPLLPGLAREISAKAGVQPFPRHVALWRLPALVLLLGCLLVLCDAWFESLQYKNRQAQRDASQARALVSELKSNIKGLHGYLSLLAFVAGNAAQVDVTELQEAAQVMNGQGLGDSSQAVYLVGDSGQDFQVVSDSLGTENPRFVPEGHFVAIFHALPGESRLLGSISLQHWVHEQEATMPEPLRLRVSTTLPSGQRRLVFDTVPDLRTQPLLHDTVWSDAQGKWEIEIWPNALGHDIRNLLARRAVMVCALLALIGYLWVLGLRRLGAESVAWRFAQDVERSRDRWMRALEATQDGVWEFDASAKYLFASQVCLELAGISNTTHRPLRAFLRSIGKEQRRRILIALRAAWQEASRLDELIALPLEQGGKRWLRIRGSVTKGHGYFTGALSDVTEEIELARARDRYQSFMAGVIDALPMAMSVKAEDGELILVNKLHAQSLGRMMGELIGKRANQFIDSKMAEQLEMLDRLVLETGRTHSLEDWFDITLGRRRVFLRVTKSRCLDENGRPVVVTTYEDQTEVRNYARRLADMNVKVQSFVERLIETIPHPVYVKDVESRYLIVNAGLADQWGLRPEEMVGRTSRELFGNDRGATIEEEDRRVLAGEVIRRQDSIFHARSAQLRHWAVTKRACLDVDGKQVIVGSNYELTDMRRAELDLLAALDQQTRMRSFLQETFDALPHPFFIKDRKHRYVMTNRAHAAFHNCTRDRIIGATSWDFASPSVAEEVEHEEERLFASPEGTQTEIEITLVDGSGRACRNRVRKVLSRDADGAPVLIGVTIDITDLLEAEARQARMRDFYQRLFDAIPLPVVVKDSQHIYQLVNKSFCDAYQRPVSEILGRGTWDFNSPEETERTLVLDNTLFQAPVGEITEREQPLNYADGQVHEVMLRKVVYEGPEGERLMVAAHTDLSRLRAAERNLRGALNRMTTLVDNAPLGIAFLGRDGQILDANVFLRGLLGYSLDELRARTYFSLVAPEQKNVTEEKQQEIQLSGVVRPFETRLLARDGVDIPVTISGVLVKVEQDAPLYWLLVADLSEQKRADAALRLSEARWQFALESSGDGIWDWNVRTGQVYYAPRWKEILGYAESDLDPRIEEWRLRIHPEDVDATMEAVRQHLDGHTLVYASEHRVRTKDGSYKWILDRGKVIERDAKGQALRMIGTRSDISLRKQAEVELRHHHDELRELVELQTASLVAAKEAAERANAAKTEFLSKVSHELRTPLHGILSFAQMGEERVERSSPEKIKEYFHRVASSGNRLVRLLDELLDISKLEAGRMEMDFQLCHPINILEETLAEFEGLLAARNLAVVREYDSDVSEITMDAKRIGQVMRNLLSNAIKFTPDGGCITMSARTGGINVGRRLSDQIELHAVELSVSDTGVGIPPEELEMIFDKFVQSSLTRAGSGGTGLGLAICREIVQAHWGQLYARNREVGGAEFVVCLPARHLELA